MLAERAQRLCHDRVVRRALVGEAFDLLGGDGVVFAQPRDDMRADGVADTVGDESLARAVELDTAAAHLRAAPGARQLILARPLVAEAAADVRLDDAII